MLENISIKKLLLVIPIVVVISFITLYVSISTGLTELEDKNIKASLSNKIIKEMLDARISEKNYVRRKESHYAKELYSIVNRALESAKELQEMFKDPQNDKLVADVITNIEQYKSLFKKYQSTRDNSLKMQKQMVKEANDVEMMAMRIRAIQKKQRDAIIRNSKNVKAIADEIEEASLANKIVKELMNMRINEKNYIARKEKQYREEVESSIDKIKLTSAHVKKILDNPANKRMIDALLTALEEYHKAFNHFSTLREESIALSTKMKKEAREAEEALIKLRKDQKSEKVALMNSLQTKLLVLFGISAFVVILFVLYISNLISKNLNLINEAAKELAMGDGDLTKRIEMKGNNEITSVAVCINKFIEKVQSAIAETKHVSSEAASISNELSATSLEIGGNVENEAELVKSINSDTEQTTQEAEFVDEKVSQMDDISEKSFELLNTTTEKINALTNSVKDASMKEEELALKMQELKDSTNDVKSILELIGDIAEQTNLLSLNAAIEAARAGEHGRGFAVVADEVRKLAERTQKSLTEINATINVVTQAVDESSDNMQENAKEIATAAEQAGDVEESIDAVMSGIENSKQMARESAEAVDKLKKRVLDISAKMAQLNDTAIKNARSVEEIAAAAEHQNEIIEELNTQLMSFKS